MKPCSAFFLVGPTAAGKTAVAHHIARADGCEILSADAMLVYRGMDIGTAKPSEAERAEVRYWGLDLVDPNQPFSVGAYFEHARAVCMAAAERGRRLIVAGGTGLYIKCLTEGLDPLPAADEALRRQSEDVLEREGVAGLQAALRVRDAAAYTALADKQNPRRLIRALELAGRGARRARGWSGPSAVPLAGLRMKPDALHARIRRRVEAMFAGGLLEEVRALEGHYGRLSKTAAQAIGYKEALAVQRGECTVEEAREVAIRRTRQLAKRQMTWFRHQARVAWVDVESDTPVEVMASRVREIWDRHGPADTAF
ncbi:MAG: tRNA (adenosine(37)-N6)-dimethylallyltransferase MiaA [Kiritimatiellae bacterium]|nr:tRNA (adenosine(37)-N6)-dimethylallyltransferase MiaA [Kiritimatiellia bacterium]